MIFSRARHKFFNMKFSTRVLVWLASMLAGAIFVHEMLAMVGVSEGGSSSVVSQHYAPQKPFKSFTQRRQEVEEIKRMFQLRGNGDVAPSGSQLDVFLRPLANRKNVVMIDGVPMMAEMAEQYLEVKRKKAIERKRPANATEIKATSASVMKLKGVSREKVTKPKKIVIVSTWRSGSTFLGQVLANYPGVFYHYEPLSYVGVKRVRDIQDQSVGSIKRLFGCHFDNKQYMNYTRNYPEDMLGHNYHVWSACKAGSNVNVCFNETFLEKSCQHFPIQVMKLVRLGLNVVDHMLTKGQLDAKVIFLVRDPRAIYNSRLSSVHWCKKSQDCMDPRNLCKDLEIDLEISRKLTKKFPHSFTAVQYENLVSEDHPKGMESLFKFLNLDYSQDLKDLVFNLTHTNEDSPWSVRRKASERVNLWQSKLDNDRLRRIQKLCKPALESLNYEIIDV